MQRESEASGIVPQRVVDLLRSAKHVVAFTGAGISAESGIPTFRDAMTGLWARFRPEDLATPEAFARDPALVWRWTAWRRGLVAAAAPNAGHLALVELERHVERVTVVTQNVDGLHRRAGSSTVIELHGDLTRTRCSREGTIVEAPGVSQRAEDGDEPPRCGCGAYLRPDVVWFGELLPYEALQTAARAVTTCDLLLSIGTSNLVEPAASLPRLARQAGVAIVVVNTTMEGQRAGPGGFQIAERAGVALPALVRAAVAGRGGTVTVSARFLHELLEVLRVVYIAGSPDCRS